MLVGYVRISSLDQKPDRQLEEMMAMKVEKFFVDKLSGKNTDRPELQKMLNYVREGDTIVGHRLDRLARNITDLPTMVQNLTDRGISIRFLNGKLTSILAMSNSYGETHGVFAEFERSMIKRCQAEGIALARERSVYKGRPPFRDRRTDPRDPFFDRRRSSYSRRLPKR